MDGIVSGLGRRAKRRLRKNLRKCRDAALATRYLIVLNLADGLSPTDTAKVLQISRTTWTHFGGGSLRFLESPRDISWPMSKRVLM